MTEREAFEAWALREGYNLDRRGDGHRAYMDTTHAEIGWQAAAARYAPVVEAAREVAKSDDAVTGYDEVRDEWYCGHCSGLVRGAKYPDPKVFPHTDDCDFAKLRQALAALDGEDKCKP